MKSVVVNQEKFNELMKENAEYRKQIDALKARCEEQKKEILHCYETIKLAREHKLKLESELAEAKKELEKAENELLSFGEKFYESEVIKRKLKSDLDCAKELLEDWLTHSDCSCFGSKDKNSCNECDFGRTAEFLRSLDEKKGKEFNGDYYCDTCKPGFCFENGKMKWNKCVCGENK